MDKLDGRKLDEEQRAILFRNARELLTNVLKHAHAKHAAVLLESDDAAVRVTVKDDGVGYDPEELGIGLHGEGGFGLFSIQERMADLGGTLKIDSAPGRGCTVVMTLPRSG